MDTTTRNRIGILLLLCLILISGITLFSINFQHSYAFRNQYGSMVPLYGYGIYAHDSYFKAPIFIGSDLTILATTFVLLPGIIKKSQSKPLEAQIRFFSLLGILAYYAASLAFGVTYNALHLIYLALLALSLFSGLSMLLHFYDRDRHAPPCSYKLPRGMILFLWLSGISLSVAWLPDIFSSFFQDSLSLIEVYTTEITYVLDIGILTPLIVIILHLIKTQRFLGYVLLRMLLKLCIVIGIMLPIQTLFQLKAGSEIALPVLFVKAGIFTLLAMSAAYLEYQLKKNTQYKNV